MLVVRGAVKDYDWGIVDGLAAWSGTATGGPQAELWFGVHPGGPSPLIDRNGDPTGQVLADHFDIEHIPILVKLLAAARPLSVQVHPSTQTALRMWRAQEDGTGQAVLSDPFEKTEMLVALGPFEAFAGWRDLDQAMAILAGVPGCEQGVAALARGDEKAAIVALLEVRDVTAAVAVLPVAASAAGLEGSELHAYATVAALNPADAGALVTPLLAFVTLSEGEAVYVPAGIPHSYVRGTGLEVMTSSDNVLRLGLTPKAVFVDEALDALEPDLEPVIMRTLVGDAVAPPGAPFAATLHRDGVVDLPTGTYRIVLLIEGSARVATALADIDLHLGTAAVLAADDPSAIVTVSGLAAVVTARGTVPAESGES
jgi:mannose-6-phosphate isomerase